MTCPQNDKQERARDKRTGKVGHTPHQLECCLEGSLVSWMRPRGHPLSTSKLVDSMLDPLVPQILLFFDSCNLRLP